MPNTYNHRTLKTRLPVRSAIFKQRIGGLVVRWVTTSEYPLLYVFAILLVVWLAFLLALVLASIEILDRGPILFYPTDSDSRLTYKSI